MSGALVTAAELARVLHVSASTVYARAAAGELPAVRIGRAVRFDLDAVMAALSVPMATPPPDEHLPRAPARGVPRNEQSPQKAHRGRLRALPADPGAVTRPESVPTEPSTGSARRRRGSGRTG